jgi:hypothetical protein
VDGGFFQGEVAQGLVQGHARNGERLEPVEPAVERRALEHPQPKAETGPFRQKTGGQVARLPADQVAQTGPVGGRGDVEGGD